MTAEVIRELEEGEQFNYMPESELTGNNIIDAHVAVSDYIKRRQTEVAHASGYLLLEVDKDKVSCRYAFGQNEDDSV